MKRPLCAQVWTTAGVAVSKCALPEAPLPTLAFSPDGRGLLVTTASSAVVRQSHNLGGDAAVLALPPSGVVITAVGVSPDAATAVMGLSSGGVMCCRLPAACWGP